MRYKCEICQVEFDGHDGPTIPECVICYSALHVESVKAPEWHPVVDEPVVHLQEAGHAAFTPDRESLPDRMLPSELKGFMEAHRLSPERLAHVLGVTEGAVSHWVTGRRSIPATTVKLIWFFNRNPSAMGAF